MPVIRRKNKPVRFSSVCISVCVVAVIGNKIMVALCVLICAGQKNRVAGRDKGIALTGDPAVIWLRVHGERRIAVSNLRIAFRCSEADVIGYAFDLKRNFTGGSRSAVERSSITAARINETVFSSSFLLKHNVKPSAANRLPSNFTMF